MNEEIYTKRKGEIKNTAEKANTDGVTLRVLEIKEVKVG